MGDSICLPSASLRATTSSTGAVVLMSSAMRFFLRAACMGIAAMKSAETPMKMPETVSPWRDAMRSMNAWSVGASDDRTTQRSHTVKPSEFGNGLRTGAPGSARVSEGRARLRNALRRAPSGAPRTTLMSSSETRPETAAVVVEIAGMILPAMRLTPSTSSSSMP
eukprot:Amastigsp_a343356_46.p3 type:complete len:165 gc:universal Amastigsp_a343356_46:43-537(+)